MRTSKNSVPLIPLKDFGSSPFLEHGIFIEAFEDCVNGWKSIDTIKLIAYRAETALAQLAREKIKRLDEARSLIRQLFRTEVDLIPDQQNKTLTVRLHPMTTQAHDEVVRHICAEITATETVFPGSDLRLIYEISSSC